MGADSDAATISRALFVGADGYVDKRSAPEDFCGAFVSAADHLMVLVGPPGEALGRVAEALIQRREVEGRLTVREREVLEVAAEGLTAREIAERLGVRERTITTHLGADLPQARGSHACRRGTGRGALGSRRDRPRRVSSVPHEQGAVVVLVHGVPAGALRLEDRQEIPVLRRDDRLDVVAIEDLSPLGA